MDFIDPDRTIDELLIRLEAEITRAKWLTSLCQENILAAQEAIERVRIPGILKKARTDRWKLCRCLFSARQ